MENHALNKDFVWQDHTGPFRAISEDQAQAYDRDGYFRMEDAFDSALIEGLLAELDPLEAQFEKILREQLGGRAFIARADEITFNVHPILRSPAARAFTRDPIFQNLAFDLLGPDVRLYWDQTVYKKPRSPERFPWHQDNGYTYVEPQQYLTCWVALTDADEENGCPVVAPGVHRGGTLLHRPTDLGFECFSSPPGEAVPVPLRAGSIAVFSSLTPHMTGPNLTADRERKAYIVQFAPDGAEVVPPGDGSVARTRCDAPDRQYPVLEAGRAPG
jgi:ectoine hydroxylase-related dioxygenase (phytanoyl-CoA dioxygenase family)